MNYLTLNQATEIRKLERAKLPNLRAYSFRLIPLRDRLYAQVFKTESCWIWLGALDRNKYGRLRARGRDHYAHRLAWEFEHGPITTDFYLCHKCDNPLCIRPSHLFLGTQKQNIQDAKTKDRLAKGERHGRVKLTEHQVLEARQKYKSGGITHQALAHEYGVSRQTMTSAITGKNWSYLA